MDLYTLSHTPAVRVLDGLFTPEECAALDALGSNWDLLESFQIDTKHDRTGFSAELPRAAHPRLAEAAQRLEEALGVADAEAGPLRFRRYSVGESHPEHMDAYAHEDLTLVVTAMLVLVAPEQGGETVFGQASTGPLALKPTPGRVFAWASYRPDGALDRASAHHAQPVTRGQKSTVTLFLYQRTRKVELPVGIDLSEDVARFTAPAGS